MAQPKENKCIAKFECDAVCRDNECDFYIPLGYPHWQRCKYQTGNLLRFCKCKAAQINLAESLIKSLQTKQQ